jgi:CRISPR-associated endoribonuclease Cas6
MAYFTVDVPFPLHNKIKIMRLKLTLNHRPNSTLSLNYHYALQAVIYKVLERADPVFSHWLHEQGYEASGKKFKLFTFSELRGVPFTLDKHTQTICFRGNSLTWQVSFCVDEGMEKFVTGLFQNQTLEVITPDGRMQLTVQNVEILTPPPFRETMRFKATMPICISEQTLTDKQPQYRAPSHEHFERLFFKNIENKYQAAFGASIPNSQPSTLKILSEPRMKGLMTYKKELDRPIKTIGYTFDFEVSAPQEWLRVSYDAGFGIKNSGGFGFCEVL